MSKPYIRYRLYFDATADKCVESVLDSAYQENGSDELVCATLPPLDDRVYPSEASVRRVVEAFFGAMVR